MVRKWPLRSPGNRNNLFPPPYAPTNTQKKFKNRFWLLEKLFLLICAWGSLKKCHFRSPYPELFRPNGEVPIRFFAVLDSWTVYLKLISATFSIYFVIFEKKVLKPFSPQNASYSQKMAPERSWSVLWTRNTLFPPPKHPNKYPEMFFQNRFWPLEKLFFLYAIEEAWKSAIFEAYTPNCLDL